MIRSSCSRSSLQALYSLSDEATEFQIKDRLSFERNLGLGIDGTVPDATTVWLFRERLVKAKAIDRLFARFDAALTERGYLAMGGQIIDATVVPAPKQRNTEAEKTAIKEGRVPEGWKPAKIRQKDRDARWSVKYTKAKVKEGADPKAAKPVDLAIPMFGYKNHIGIDRAHGLIRTWDASAAKAHDGARLPEVVSKDKPVPSATSDARTRFTTAMCPPLSQAVKRWSVTAAPTRRTCSRAWLTCSAATRAMAARSIPAFAGFRGQDGSRSSSMAPSRR